MSDPQIGATPVGMPFGQPDYIFDTLNYLVLSVPLPFDPGTEASERLRPRSTFASSVRCVRTVRPAIWQQVRYCPKLLVVTDVIVRIVSL